VLIEKFAVDIAAKLCNVLISFDCGLRRAAARDFAATGTPPPLTPGV
jgi:hypothetical protein